MDLPILWVKRNSTARLNPGALVVSPLSLYAEQQCRYSRQTHPVNVPSNRCTTFFRWSCPSRLPVERVDRGADPPKGSTTAGRRGRLTISPRSVSGAILFFPWGCFPFLLLAVLVVQMSHCSVVPSIPSTDLFLEAFLTLLSSQNCKFCAFQALGARL